jgi:hypothetical protein
MMKMRSNSLLPLFLKEETSLVSSIANDASMVLPLNDAFLSNGNSTAHEIFDSNGDSVDVLIENIGAGADVLDAGSEENDEIPANTAFFGQMAPDAGIDYNGVVTTHPGFMPFREC